jgi:IS4 transposase
VPKATEADLSNWKLVQEFQRRLAEAQEHFALHPSFKDPKRQLLAAQYLSLFLFGLFNPVVRTMRGLCEASRLDRVRREICGASVSLGSFSEIQHLIEPELLQRVFEDLAAELPEQANSDPRLISYLWMARDGSLFNALPRMSWALFGAGRSGTHKAARLHLSYQILGGKPVRAQLTEGRRCERAVWKEQWRAGEAYIGDRYFAENYQLLGQMQELDCRYVLRLREPATITVEEELPLSPADRQMGVLRQAWARLGCRPGKRSVRVRVVWLEKVTEGEMILLTNLDAQRLPAELVALLYRQRWQVELFFRWIKCLLGCKHWLAESRQGATLQIYLALIAAVLLQLYTGQRPTRRMLELIQFYLMGVASLEELTSGLQRHLRRLKTVRSN